MVSGIRVWEALKEKKRKRGLGVAFREPLRVNEQDLDEVREFEYEIEVGLYMERSRGRPTDASD